MNIVRHKAWYLKDNNMRFIIFFLHEYLSNGIWKGILKISWYVDIFVWKNGAHQVIEHPGSARFAICPSYCYNRNIFWKIGTTKVQFSNDFSTFVYRMTWWYAWWWDNRFIAKQIYICVTIIFYFIRNLKMREELFQSFAHSSFSINKYHIYAMNK